MYLFYEFKIDEQKALLYSDKQTLLKNLLNSNLNHKKKQYDMKRFIITISPNHHNFGDEAILLATIQFLRDYFPQIKRIIIKARETLINMHLIKNIINNDDIIIISGGGYFGLYENIIKEQVNILNNFPNNKIIFFPCSIFYDEHKKLEYTHYLEVINRHKYLTFFIRDETSFSISKKLFLNSSIYQVPDIATRLNLSILMHNLNNRNGILLILRKDELLLDSKDREFIRNISKKYFKNEVKEIDSNNFSVPKGSSKLNETINFIKLIKSKKLVITDRLHGMILSIISGIPNIVFGNSYHKVESSYNSWFKNISYSNFIKKEEIKNKLEPTILKIITIYL